MFKKTFLTHFRVDDKTKVILTDNIKNDPIEVFLKLIGSVVWYKIKRIDEITMLRTINTIYHYIKPGKGRKFNYWHKNKLIDKLIQYNRFEFITEPNWFENLKFKRPRVRIAYMRCAIGILYAYLREYLTKSVQESRRKKLINEIDKYNTNMESNYETK